MCLFRLRSAPSQNRHATAPGCRPPTGAQLCLPPRGVSVLDLFAFSPRTTGIVLLAMSTSASTIFSPPVTAEDLEKRAPTLVDETVVGSGRPSEENSKRPSAEDKGMAGADVGNDNEKTSRLVDTLDPHESPKHFSTGKKWAIVLVLGMGTTFATAASSIVRFAPLHGKRVIHAMLQHSFAEHGAMDAFGVSLEVSILGISLFVLGIGIGYVSPTFSARTQSLTCVAFRVRM